MSARSLSWVYPVKIGTHTIEKIKYDDGQQCPEFVAWKLNFITSPLCYCFSLLFSLWLKPNQYWKWGSSGVTENCKTAERFHKNLKTTSKFSKNRRKIFPCFVCTASVLCCRLLPRYHFTTQKGKANSNALNLLEKMKLSRLYTKSYRTGQLLSAFSFNFVII